MRIVLVEHRRLILDPTYRNRMRPILKRAHNCRGQARGVRISVLHQEECCELQPFAETERAVLNVGVVK